MPRGRVVGAPGGLPAEALVFYLTSRSRVAHAL